MVATTKTTCRYPKTGQLKQRFCYGTHGKEQQAQNQQ